MGHARIGTGVAVLLLLIVGPFAHAAQRTFVASNGADGNPCSIVAPCRSFTVAMAAVDSKGEVIALDSAGYGSFTIDKAVSVIAPPGVYAGISVFASTDGVVVNAPGAVVAIRGLSINGQGGNRGIVVTNAASVHVDGCTISNVGSAGVVIDANANVEMADTVIRNPGASGVVVNDGKLTVVRLQVRETGSRGIEINNGKAVIRDSMIAKTTAVGIYGHALAGQTAEVTVERTTITETGFEGIFASAAGGTATIVAVNNVISDNAGFSGIVASGTGATMRASGNTVTRVKAFGLRSNGAALYESAQDNFVQGNVSGTTTGTINIVGKF